MTPGPPIQARPAGRRAGGSRVAVVGATGNVGRVMLEVLRERGLGQGPDELVLFASPRSKGLEVDGLPIQVLDDDADLDQHRHRAVQRRRLDLARVGRPGSQPPARP